jgi:23S rRNA pseudouridine2605 synthase
MAEERLQKIIAAAGLASRRKAEGLITSGVVQVNGHTITELGAKANPARDDIRVNGQRVAAQQHLYIMLNKPKGYVTTTVDPEGRPTVMDLVQLPPRARGLRLFPVGRLDFNSEGLLLLTNDGEIAHKLTHASSLVPKTYMVKVSGTPPEEEIERLRQGVSITSEKDPRKRVRTAAARIRKTRDAENPWYELTLIEGRNRQIRKMFEEIGHHVEKIRRVRYGPLHLNVQPGQWRSLAPQEVRMLRNTKQLRQGEEEAPREPRVPSERKRIPPKRKAGFPKTGRSGASRAPGPRDSRSPRGPRDSRDSRGKRNDRRGPGRSSDPDSPSARKWEGKRGEGSGARKDERREPKAASRSNRAERFRNGEYPQTSSAVPRRGQRSTHSGPKRGSVRAERGRRG